MVYYGIREEGEGEEVGGEGGEEDKEEVDEMRERRVFSEEEGGMVVAVAVAEFIWWRWRRLIQTEPPPWAKQIIFSFLFGPWGWARQYGVAGATPWPNGGLGGGPATPKGHIINKTKNLLLYYFSFYLF
jgi:hypothetical protein